MAWIRQSCTCTLFHSSCRAVILASLNLRFAGHLHLVDLLEFYLRGSSSWDFLVCGYVFNVCWLIGSYGSRGGLVCLNVFQQLQKLLNVLDCESLLLWQRRRATGRGLRRSWRGSRLRSYINRCHRLSGG